MRPILAIIVLISAGATAAQGGTGHPVPRVLLPREVSLEASASQNPTPLQRIFRYDAADGGVWRQDNGDFVPGSGEAEHWVRVVRWGLGGDIVLVDNFAVFEDERYDHLFHAVYRWDPSSQEIRTTSDGRGGMRISGSAHELDEGVLRTEIQVTLPDGSELRMRDTADRSDHLVTTAVGERWDGNAWVATDTVQWRRTQDSACPAGDP